jgi:hypothetical protein
MRVRRLWLVVVVLLIPTAGRAHDHKADFFGAFSLAKGSTSKGAHEVLAVSLPMLDHDLSVLFDSSFHVGSENGQRLTRIGYMIGARYTFPGQPDVHKNRFSVHGLVGGVRSHADAQVDNDPAIAVGGGWEFVLRGDKAAAGWAYRLQADYVFRSDDDFLRLSGGIAYLFKRP